MNAMEALRELVRAADSPPTDDRIAQMQRFERFQSALAAARATVESGEAQTKWIGPLASAWEALNETRKIVAIITGNDPETWPDHGNAPLAIAATMAILANLPKAGEGAQPVAWIDSNGHPHHLSAFQTVTERRMHGAWAPLYAHPPAPAVEPKPCPQG